MSYLHVDHIFEVNIFIWNYDKGLFIFQISEVFYLSGWITL